MTDGGWMVDGWRMMDDGLVVAAMVAVITVVVII